jgi:hypothetical protein
MAHCEEAACPQCGTVAFRVPDEEGTWAFDEAMNGAKVCRSAHGDIYIHV